MFATQTAPNTIGIICTPDVAYPTGPSGNKLSMVGGPQMRNRGNMTGNGTSLSGIASDRPSGMASASASGSASGMGVGVGAGAGAGAGALSPPASGSGSRSGASSPARQRFPADQLRSYMRTVIQQTLQGATWDAEDKARMATYSKGISDQVKAKMMEFEPQGFKYIVTTTMSQNLGQAGRADMSCHWEDTDIVIQEMFSNETILLVCVAFAVRVI